MMFNQIVRIFSRPSGFRSRQHYSLFLAHFYERDIVVSRPFWSILSKLSGVEIQL